MAALGELLEVKPQIASSIFALSPGSVIHFFMAPAAKSLTNAYNLHVLARDDGGPIICHPVDLMDLLPVDALSVLTEMEADMVKRGCPRVGDVDHVGGWPLRAVMRRIPYYQQLYDATLKRAPTPGNGGPGGT